MGIRTSGLSSLSRGEIKVDPCVPVLEKDLVSADLSCAAGEGKLGHFYFMLNCFIRSFAAKNIGERIF